MTSTDIIKDMFLSLINDRELAIIAQEDAEHLINNWLRFATMEFHNCRKDLTIEKTNEFESHIIGDLDNEEIGILAYAMLLSWVEPKIRCLDVIKSKVNTREFNQTSNANLLSKLNDLHELSEKKVRTLKNRYQSKDMVGLG